MTTNAQLTYTTDGDADFENAHRGFIATLPNAEIRNPGGQVVWTLEGYEFLAGRRPHPRYTRISGGRPA